MTKFRESALEDRWEAKAARINVHRAKRFQELHRSKVRAIGICEQELRQQVKDHEQRELNEREEELAYAQYIGNVADEMQVMENEHTKERRRKRQELQNVWDLQHKMRSKRAEWDLYDPKQLAKDSLPMEETSGPSSAQFIKGIPDSKELDREKKRAQLKLIDETLKEREAKLALDRQLEAEDAELARQQLALRLQRELEDAKKRKDYDAYVRKINDQLIELKKLEAANLKAIEDARAAREHQYIEENKDLRETRSKMYNSAGKIVRQEWKGMTPAELARIAQEQRDQAEAARLAREQERKNNRAEEDNFERARLLALQMENQAELARRTKAKQVVGCIQLQDQIYQEKRDERRRYDQEPAGGWWPFSSADR